jgi:O-antigen/teichoic acid export membrane protein
LANTGALAFSNLWRIVVSFLLQLLIARRLGVEALGIYAIAMAYLNVTQVISELGLPGLLVRDLAQHPNWRRTYFRRALLLQGGAALLTWSGLALFAGLAGFAPETRNALWIIGASLPAYALTSVTQTLFQAGERMELVLGVEFVINSLILLASLMVIWLGGSVQALVSVVVVTQLISGLGGWWLLRGSGLLAESQPSSLQGAELRRLAAPFYAQSLGDVLLQRADLLLIGLVGGPTVAGIYSAAYNLVRVLLKLVQSFLQALYPTLSRLRGQAPTHFWRVATWSARWGLALTVVSAAVVSTLAMPTLQLVYGADYAEAAPVLTLLVWMAPLVLLESYGAARLMVERRTAHSLLISGGHLLTLVLLLPLLTAQSQAVGAAQAALAAAFIGAGISVLLLRTVHKQ